MGRHKIGKPRRERVGMRSVLRDLEPPGELYEKWFQVEAGMDFSWAAQDGRLDEDSFGFIKRLAGLGGLYEGLVPLAALMLDEALDSGYFPIHDGDGGRMLPLADAAARFASFADNPDAVRESIHRLHAGGVLLVEEIDGVVLTRMVGQRPRPGEPWVFMDELPEGDNPRTCIPDEAAAAFSTQEFMVFAYLRHCLALSIEGTPEGFLQFTDGADVDDVPALFAAVKASGWVDSKGCAACPVSASCTRTLDGTSVVPAAC